MASRWMCFKVKKACILLHTYLPLYDFWLQIDLLFKNDDQIKMPVFSNDDASTDVPAASSNIHNPTTLYSEQRAL